MSPALTFSLRRQESPLILMVVGWCRILSRMAVVITESPKISFHWEKLRFEDRIKAPFLYLLETSGKNRCAPCRSIGT